MGVLGLLSCEDATADCEFPFLAAPAPQLSVTSAVCVSPGSVPEGPHAGPRVHACSVASLVSSSWRPYGLARPASLSLDSPDENAGVGCPPPGDLPTQG